MKVFLIIILILVLAAIGFYVGRNYLARISPANIIAPNPITATSSQTQNQTLGGQINSAVSNPVNQIPQTNPYKAVNPYSNVKTNPFAQ